MQKVFHMLCESIEARYLQLKSTKRDALKNEYLNILYRFNIPANYTVDGKIIQGKIVDVLDDGKLVLEDDHGKTNIYAFKEISFVI